MNVLDVNLLLYAHDERAALHKKAKTWLEREFNKPEPTGLALSTVLSFVRIATSSRILVAPFSVEDACALVDEWLLLSSVVLLLPTERHWRVVAGLAVASNAAGALLPDADLAATALEHGATLCTHDRDFARFPNLHVTYPLAA